MVGRIRYYAQWLIPAVIGALLLALVVFVERAHAITQLPDPDPIPGAYGLEATKPKPPPTEGAQITIPGNGASFTTSPIDVRGICPKDLLVQVYNNGVLAGSVMCTNGSFDLKVTLYSGTNELSAIVYDSLDQAGPKSNTVRVTYNNMRFEAFGQLITLTSSYGRRSAAAGTPLSWPLQLSGGTGPYAFSIDWGDGSQAELKSQESAGLVTIRHIYKRAGIYQVNIRVTDANGVSAFLQVVAVANGIVDSSTAAQGDKTSGPRAPQPAQILWWPTAVALVMLVPSYWLGRMSQVVSIRNKMLRDRDSYQAN